MKKYTKFMMIIAGVAVVLGQIFAAPLSVDKDVEIMESVLDKIIVEDSPIYFTFGNDFQGTYYEDFGIILKAESSGFFDMKEQLELVVPESRKFLFLDENGRDLVLDADEKERVKILKKREKELEELQAEKQATIDEKLVEVKSALEGFFLNYARGAVTMKDNEKIIVNIKIDNDSRGKKYQIPAFIQMTGTVNDLKKYYAGKIDEDKMKKKLSFEAPAIAENRKDIEVMENIFDTFLEKEAEFWSTRNKTDGFYLDGFGAVFNIPVNLGNGFLPITINRTLIREKVEDAQKQLEKAQEKLEKYQIRVEQKIPKEKNTDHEDSYVYTTDDSGKTKVIVKRKVDDDLDIDVDVDVKSDGESEFITFSNAQFDDAKKDSILNKTKTDVIKTLSIYGGTLKSVKDNENITLNIVFDNYRDDKTVSLVCSKENVLDYTNGKISYEKFVDNIKIKK